LLRTGPRPGGGRAGAGLDPGGWKQAAALDAMKTARRDAATREEVEAQADVGPTGWTFTSICGNVGIMDETGDRSTRRRSGRP
jgi:hypothetical protein